MKSQEIDAWENVDERHLLADHCLVMRERISSSISTYLKNNFLNGQY